jgi:hypothetical protein
VKLEAGWEEHFGYLKDLGYAVCIGEFGGNMEWPNKSEARHRARYSYLTDKTTDEQWQNAFVNYLIKKKMYDSFYWSINPESADTYGIFKSPYDPVSNTTGWGTWSQVDSKKLNLLGRLWNATGSTPVVPARQGAAEREFACRVSGAGLITYTIPQSEVVSLQLYNAGGRLHSQIPGRLQQPGSYSLDQRHFAAARGSYVLVFKAGEYVHRQMVHLTE